jgi:hypothetical protein
MRRSIPNSWSRFSYFTFSPEDVDHRDYAFHPPGFRFLPKEHTPASSIGYR